MLNAVDICLAYADEFMRPESRVRTRLRAYREARSVALGAHMRLHFEDAITLAYQVMEITRAELSCTKPTRDQFVDEIAHYAALHGYNASLTATLFLAADDLSAAPETSAPSLVLLNEAAHCVYLTGSSGVRIDADVNSDLSDRHRQRASGVHFLRFAGIGAGVVGSSVDTVACDFSSYRARARLPVTLTPATAARLTQPLASTP
jgi:hypothetical protein